MKWGIIVKQDNNKDYLGYAYGLSDLSDQLKVVVLAMELLGCTTIESEYLIQNGALNNLSNALKSIDEKLTQTADEIAINETERNNEK